MLRKSQTEISRAVASCHGLSDYADPEPSRIRVGDLFHQGESPWAEVNRVVCVRPRNRIARAVATWRDAIPRKVSALGHELPSLASERVRHLMYGFLRDTIDASPILQTSFAFWSSVGLGSLGGIPSTQS